MKKVLFATTALIATASVASAEITFSGAGRFGIGYQEDRTVTETLTAPGADGIIGTGDDVAIPLTVEGPDTILVSRFRLNIDANAETDGGVEFQARVRLQAEEDSSTGEADAAGLNGARFSVIYGGLRVDAGNVAGSFDNLPGYYGTEIGLELFAGQYSGVDYDFLAYSSAGTGANAVFFQYSVGDFAFLASYDQQDAFTVNAGGTTLTRTEADRWDVGLAYTFNNITAAIAYGENDANESLVALALSATFGDFTGGLFVADDDVAAAASNGTAWGISGAYQLGAATTLQFAYGDGDADADLQQIAVGAIYDLGGGVSLRGGVGQNDSDAGDSQIVADFGVNFNF